MKTKLKILLYIDIAVLLVLSSYKGYLYFFERDFNSINAESIDLVQNGPAREENYSFAVVGNIQNSIEIFDRKMSDSINRDRDIAFVISAGNAVLDGAEDKYRILSKSTDKIKVPVIAGIGEKEITEDGALRFYKHFGPFYFSFAAGDSYFIFLDTTGLTSEKWQKTWLAGELNNAAKYGHTFVFMNKPPFAAAEESFLSKTIMNNETPYISDPEYSKFLRETFSAHKVDAVFASGLKVYDKTVIDGVAYYMSGGGGGSLVIQDDRSFYHYLKVNVKGAHVSCDVVRVEDVSGFWAKTLESLWIYIHSIFYINFANFILILCLLACLGILIYFRASREVNYFRDFTCARDRFPEKEKLKIAMFTNNYFPFIGGVPISIDRLARGLRELGHTVYIFAPRYPGAAPDDDGHVIRCGLLTYHRTKIFDFAVVNIFSPQIEREFLRHDFDVIHVHHPFWMGKKGLMLGKKHRLPVIFTYHTRFDIYNHYLPFLKLVFKNIFSHRMIHEFAQQCHAVFAPTETAKEYLSNIGVSRRTVVLPTGIDFTCFDHVPPENVRAVRESYVNQGEVLLCSVSRLSREKNIDFLLEGLKYIRDHTTAAFKCIIIGDGPERENIACGIERENLQDIVILVGPISPGQVSKFYQASDLFVFSSKSETQGMVLLEAMAGKCPVVAVTSSGTEDVIRNDYNGYKTKDDVAHWSQKVIGLLENQDKLREMSENAYVFARKFSVQAMAKKAARVYRQTAREKLNFLAAQGIKKSGGENGGTEES